jgi:xylulose-5-phosphate/fructose-6-phosphate phosphoketolase
VIFGYLLNARGAKELSMVSLVKESAKRKSESVQPLSADELRKMDAYWRACNYLCVGMLYLLENPLLR